MGFVGFLRFSLLCFDFLAWPVFALGYPLWASIRAIETSSKHHMRKLVTYWTIFSLISLFEIFFVKLIQWVPLWPYIKLVTFCWLVIPQFNGACHVYQCLIRSCLSVNTQDIINWFCIPKEKPSSEESFLALAEAYLKENGPEALEKLITSKAKGKEHIVTEADALQVVKRVEPTGKNVTAEEQMAKGKEHILTDADALQVVKRVEPTEKNVTAEEQLIERPKPHLDESDKKEIASAEAQRVTTPEESEEKKPLEIHALKRVQREWACAMCQVTTTSEALLNSHLLGRKHRSKCEKLKASTHTAKNMQSSAAKHKFKSEECTQTANNLKSAAVKTKKSNQAPKNLKICLPGEGSKQSTTEKAKSTHISAASGQQLQEMPRNNNAGFIDQQSRLWCGICNITCPGEIDMIAHLKGSWHGFMMQGWINSICYDPSGTALINCHHGLSCGRIGTGPSIYFP